MANSLKIDTTLLNVNWTTNTNYTLNLGSGLVQEETGNKSPSAPISNVKTFTTFNSGPTISSVNPTYGTTGSFTTTVSINFNRTIYKTTSNQNLYVYKEISGGTDELISTIPASNSRITADEKTISIDLRNIVEGNSTYYLTNDNSALFDMFKFPSQQLNSSNFKYSTGAGPALIGFNGTTTIGTFLSTATLYFDKTIYKDSYTNTNSLSVYTSSGTLVQKYYTTSSLVVASNTSLNINLISNTFIEGQYYILFDKGYVKDVNTFPISALTNTNIVRWYQSVVSNLDQAKTYNSNRKNLLFSSNTPQILDVDNSTSTVYTITLSSLLGEFASDDYASDVSSNWSFSGTKSQINSIFSQIRFFPTKDSYATGTFTYTQTKNGILQTNKTVSLIGVNTAFETVYELFTTSRTWKPEYSMVKYAKANIAIIAGGGGGGWNEWAGGGGGGETIVLYNQSLQLRDYVNVIGAGGLASTTSTIQPPYNQVVQMLGNAQTGGNTSFDSGAYIAQGGTGGTEPYALSNSSGQFVSFNKGGDGGTSGIGHLGQTGTVVSGTPQGGGGGGAGGYYAYTGTNVFGGGAGISLDVDFSGPNYNFAVFAGQGGDGDPYVDTFGVAGGAGGGYWTGYPANGQFGGGGGGGWKNNNNAYGDGHPPFKHGSTGSIIIKIFQ